MKNLNVIIDLKQEGKLGFEDVQCANVFITLMKKEALQNNIEEWKSQITLGWNENEKRKSVTFSYELCEANQDDKNPIQEELLRKYIEVEREIKNKTNIKDAQDLIIHLVKYKEVMDLLQIVID
ncbi:hypothetical protein P9Z80_24075 [Bacillus cereus]|nr:hypothetical protein [Bacillus cereus]MEC3260689.1 hypothetical protein [Bacillus cereus]